MRPIYSYLIPLVKKMKCFKKLKESAIEKLHAHDNYLLDIFSKQTLENMKNGFVHIDGDLICKFIKKALEEEEGVILKSCTFSESGIELQLSISRSAAEMLIPLNLIATKAALNKYEQQIEFEVHYNKPIGNNFIGKIASACAGGIINNIINGKILDNPLITESNRGKSAVCCVADLSRLEQIQKLSKKIPLLNICVFDLLNIADIKHVDGGIEIIGSLSMNSRSKDPEESMMEKT